MASYFLILFLVNSITVVASSSPACAVDGQAASGCAHSDDEVSFLQGDHQVHKSAASAKPVKATHHAATKGWEAFTQADSVPAFSFRNVMAEFIAMTLFVWVGCGSAMSIAKKEGSAWVLQVSLVFGLAITVLAYTIGHYSGAQINGAVSLALWVSGRIGIGQLVCNFIAQMLGSILGALILNFMYGADNDCTGGLGTNGVAEGWRKEGALIGEVMGTFLLVYVVHETAVNPLGEANLTLAPLAIGLSVFLAHCVLIPIDGCSINPTRSFGPALVCSMTRKGTSPFKDMWIFWVGPIVGALLASLVYYWMRPAF